MRAKEQPVARTKKSKRGQVNSGTAREWRAVACYFRNELDRKSQDMAGLRISLTALAIGDEMKAQAMREIRAWLASERRNQKKGKE